MSFLSSLSRKLGFTGGDEDERSEELEENELEEDEEEEEEDVGSRFSFRFPFGHAYRNKTPEEAYDEEEEEEEPVPARQPPSARASARRNNNVIHDSRIEQRGSAELQYTHCERIVNVRQIEECREIIKHLLHGESVLLNLENIDPKDCGRVVDLLSGAAFALQGRMIKVAHLSYLLAPENVEIIEEDVYAAGHMRYNR